MKGAANNPIELLITDEERAVKLDELLGERFTERGRQHMPTLNVYETLDTNEGLQALAKDFCRWLGIKPHHLKVQFSDESYQPAPLIHTEHVITIDRQFIGHPLTVGGFVALGIIQYFIRHHKDYQTGDDFIEFASVHTGLGSWVLNALRPKMSKRESIYHIIDGGWLQREGLQLSSYTPQEYARQYMRYVHAYAIHPADYLKGVSNRIRYLLPKDPTPALADPTITRKHLHRANTMWLRLSIWAVIPAVITVIALYVWSQRVVTSPDKSRDFTALQVLEQSYKACDQRASEQLSEYDPNDIFLARQVDDTKSRCESLRNEYNYALDQYQKSYPQ